jgi:nucleotide sugar dehydrogenase
MSVDLAVIGLGYVGLPLVRAATGAGLSVVGVDTNPEVVDGVNTGSSHVDDVTATDLTAMLSAGFRASKDESELAAADVAVICVPTPLSHDHRPDLRAVVAATRAVAHQLHPGMLVVLESTTYPGTTDEVVRPILEESGLMAGDGFHLAYSPERVDPGNRTFNTHNTPKVVGGQTAACTERAAAFYRRFVRTVVTTRGTREAETAKLLENTYRHVNIALVNEMARFCHELRIDLWDVIRAAATKPFGFQAFYPGPGVGGHCIPIDPNYLTHNVRTKLGYPFRLAELAQEINAAMPRYVAQRAQRILNDAGRPVKDAMVLLLGVTYKPDVTDQRESPAIPLARHLADLGASLWYHDPHVAEWRVPGVRVSPVDRLEPAVATADLTILVQGHKDYSPDRLAKVARRFLDTRGTTTVPEAERL